MSSASSSRPSKRAALEQSFSWDLCGGGGDGGDPESPGDDSDGNSSDEDPDFSVGEGAGVEFVETLISLHYDGKLSAKAVCVLSWFASRAGAKGPADKLGTGNWNLEMIDE